MAALLKGFFGKIHEINERYKHPKIHQSRPVVIALLILRIYLLFSVALLIYKFVLTLRGE